MVTWYERARQRVSLFFQPAVETTREIVSQIPGVDIERPISPVPGTPGLEPTPRRPSGRGGGGGGVVFRATPTITIGESEAEKQSRLRQEAERKANEERIRLEIEKQRQATIEFQSRQLGLPPGAAALVPYKPVGEVVKPPLARRIKTGAVERVRGVFGLPTVASRAYAEFQAEEEKLIAERGRFIPTKPGEVPVKKTLEFVPEFVSDQELEKMSFGGLDQLTKRRQARLDFEVQNVVTQKISEVEPGFNKKIDTVIKKFGAGKLTQQQAETELRTLEEDFKTKVLEKAQPEIDIKAEDVQGYLNAVAKRQRRSRALKIAPIVAVEGYVFGSALRGVVGGARLGAAALGLKGGGEVARIAITTGFVGALASQTPQIVQGIKTDPLAFTLENAPFLAGAIVGANPKIVRNLGAKSKQFIKFERQLFKDTRAKAQGTKQRSKQKQVQTEKKAEVSKKDLKDAIKKASDTELKDWMQKANKELDLIKDPIERQLAKQRLTATVLEAKTGVAIFDESGNILLGQLENALNKAGVRIKPKARFPSQVKARIPPFEAEAPALGVIEGRIPVAVLAPTKLKLKLKEISAEALIKKSQQQQRKRETLLSKQMKKQEAEQRQLAKQIQESTTKQISRLAQPQIQIPKQMQVQPQIQITEQMLRQVPRQPTRPAQPLIPPLIPIPIPLISLERKPKAIIPPTPQGYNVFGKQIKTQKFMKLNKVPLTKANAENLGSYLIDNSL
ncbi:MAG TPA: hypothetical protein ENI22_01885, partial [Candidatus Pacearchaeota archaeon]|nr:hypothetical protein [Candidatus Pacearchaeota archaeon]